MRPALSEEQVAYFCSVGQRAVAPPPPAWLAVGKVKATVRMNHTAHVDPSSMHEGFLQLVTLGLRPGFRDKPSQHFPPVWLLFVLDVVFRNQARIRYCSGNPSAPQQFTALPDALMM